jgi:hypothetical protein
LPGHSAYYAHGYRILKSSGAAESQHHLTLPKIVVLAHGQCLEALRFDLEQREVNVSGYANNPGVHGAASGGESG